ncbi:MAG: hypothetical protein ACYDEX_00100 [Mobilitalea sp.]
MNKAKNHNIIRSIIIAIFIIVAIALILNWSVIFQKGNPIPYLKSISQLNANQTYIQVQDDDSIIFVTKRDNYDELHEYIEDSYDVSFDEQLGSGYIFSSDEKVITVTSEIYWKYYIVWTMRIK